MAMHLSILLIEGDHMSRLTEILEEFGVTDTGKDILCSTSEEMWKELSSYSDDRQLERYAVCICKGWTVIVDPNGWMFTDDACNRLSRDLSSRIFAIVCEGGSGSYGFVLYEGGEQVRFYLETDGDIMYDSGTPLEIESDLDKTDLFEDDMLLMMSLMGVSYDDIEAAESFLVKELRSPELSPKAKAKSSKKKRKRRFWK